MSEPKISRIGADRDRIEPIAIVRAEVDQIMDKLFAEIMKMRQSSADAYAPNPNRPFQNFEEEAEEFGLSPEMVLMQRAQKHWKFLVNWVRSTPEQRAAMEAREPINSRISDLVLYIGLFAAMIQEPNSTRFVSDRELVSDRMEKWDRSSRNPRP